MTPCIKRIEAMDQANVAGKETQKTPNSHATAAGGNAFALAEPLKVNTARQESPLNGKKISDAVKQQIRSDGHKC